MKKPVRVAGIKKRRYEEATFFNFLRSFKLTNNYRNLSLWKLLMIIVVVGLMI